MVVAARSIVISYTMYRSEYIEELRVVEGKFPQGKFE